MQSPILGGMHAQPEVIESRAQATRHAILAAARKVFVRKGFHRATVDDITRAAHVAHGTFYRYFRNKQDALHGLVAQAVSTLQLPERDWAHEDVFVAVRDDIAAYFENYAANTDLARIWVEAASYDEKIAQARKILRMPFLQRIHAQITTAIEAELVPPLDVEVAAMALACMVDNFAYHWFVVDGHHDNVDHLAATLAALWARGLGCTVPVSPRQPAATDAGS
jgi:AcrR family transcriptional regulator